MQQQADVKSLRSVVDFGVIAALLVTFGSQANSCAPAYRLDSDPSLGAVPVLLPSEHYVTFERLSAIETRLIALDRMRADAVMTYGFLLLIPSLNQRYEQACAHHQLLFEQVKASKLELASTSEQAPTIEEWATKTNFELEIIMNFIDYVKQNHYAPKGWEPPQGFEYLRTIKN